MKNIKVTEKMGERPGKTTVILAGVHGNETCGVKALDEIIPTIEIENGKVIFIYSNLEAIKQNKRCIDKNLNRCFLREQPQEIFNSLEGATAREIIPYLERADLMLDVHASFVERSLPFIILDEKNIGLANIFDVGIISYNWDAFEPGSSDYFMNMQNRPGICFECGYLGDEESLTRAKNTILNFLKFAGNIEGNLAIRNNQKFIRIQSIFKNYFAPFRKVKDLPDFWRANERTLIGKEGDKEVFLEKGEVILFLMGNDKLGEECFLTAEETLINEESLTKLPKELK